jgi:hypothetical protein
MANAFGWVLDIFDRIFDRISQRAIDRNLMRDMKRREEWHRQSRQTLHYSLMTKVWEAERIRASESVVEKAPTARETQGPDE